MLPTWLQYPGEVLTFCDYLLPDGAAGWARTTNNGIYTPTLCQLSYYDTLPLLNLRIRNFGILLSPDTFSARKLLTSELLRFL
jgi:hypothetical protein